MQAGAALKAGKMKFSVEWFERMASTNGAMRERFFSGADLRNGLIIAARDQTAGRGRQDRQWLSAPGRNLCFSLFIETGAELSAVPSLTMAAALAVNDLLRSMHIRSAPKWPNDVMVQERKICGILSERVERDAPPAAGPGRGIIVGIGLNVNMSSEEAGRIDRPATSVLMESGRAEDINRLLEALFDPLSYWICEWEKGGFAALRDPWTEKAGPVGRTLTVHDGEVRKHGTLAGFGEHGELLLQTDNGIETIWSGDVS
jgi:BirA family biotin operon repressor/biotin-[acetyl-CoA-carboxylase] ligase